MKKKRTTIQITVIAIALLFTHSLFAQEKKERVSPPATVISSIEGSTITITYGQPSVKGRKIWGALVPYNEVWRTGANEATTFETTKDVKIEGVLLPAGKYSFFTVPGENEWIIVFNKVATQWGAYKYDQKEDQLRVKVKPSKTSELNEKLTYSIEKDKVLIRWEYLEVGFKISK